jgi:hypothetical protein
MCTVTWIREDTGYQLFCNRDEKRTRKSAEPPRLSVRNGVRFLAPADGEFGGTWIATNEFGLTLCLLNGGSGTGVRSRGLLVLDLTVLESIEAVLKGIRTCNLSAYAPFTLLAVEPGKLPAVIGWSGSRKGISRLEQRHFMLTSSSFDSDEVRHRRQKQYSQVTSAVCTPGLVEEFHRSHGEAPSAYSVCMHRPDAQTVSFSHVRVSQSRSEFRYIAGAPCSKVGCAALQATIER